MRTVSNLFITLLYEAISNNRVFSEHVFNLNWQNSSHVCFFPPPLFNRAACKLFLVKYSRTTCYVWNSVNRSGFQKNSNNIETALENAAFLFSIPLRSIMRAVSCISNYKCTVLHWHYQQTLTYFF